MDPQSDAGTGVTIRECMPADLPDLGVLYPLAFPTEELRPLVRALVGADDALSLVATRGDRLAGHVAFTRVGIEGTAAAIALLGPLAVAPAEQRRGIGSALVRAGFDRLARAGIGRVLVAGDPAYYRRFGFGPETGIMPPYPLPEEWREGWQSVEIGAAAGPVAGILRVPEFWRRPELWAP